MYASLISFYTNTYTRQWIASPPSLIACRSIPLPIIWTPYFPLLRTVTHAYTQAECFPNNLMSLFAKGLGRILSIGFAAYRADYERSPPAPHNESLQRPWDGSSTWSRWWSQSRLRDSHSLHSQLWVFRKARWSLAIVWRLVFFLQIP